MSGLASVSSLKLSVTDLNNNLRSLANDIENIKREIVTYKTISNMIPAPQIQSIESRFENIEKAQTTFNTQYNTLNTNFTNMINTINSVLKKIEDQSNETRNNTNMLKLLKENNVKQQNNIMSSVVNDANDLTDAPNGTIASDLLNNIHLKVNDQIFTLKKNAVISRKNDNINTNAN